MRKRDSSESHESCRYDPTPPLSVQITVKGGVSGQIFRTTRKLIVPRASRSGTNNCEEDWTTSKSYKYFFACGSGGGVMVKLLTYGARSMGFDPSLVTMLLETVY